MIKVGPDQLFRPHKAAEARAAIAAMAARKTDLVKIWLDDFGGGVPAKMSLRGLYRRHRRSPSPRHSGRPHMSADLADAKAIVAAGADILAHGVRDLPVDAEFIAALKTQGVWYVPTLSLDDATFAWAEQAPGPELHSPERPSRPSSPARSTTRPGGQRCWPIPKLRQRGPRSR